jgi:ParB family chromosome partitioning protein
MPLPEPKKGTGAATGKIKLSRREQLAAMAEELASEQIPATHTIEAIERAPASKGGSASQETSPSRHERGAEATVTTPVAVDDAKLRPASPSLEPVGVIRSVQIARVRPSPFQPKGRPSSAAIAAVERAMSEAGSLQALVSPEGGPVFSRLTSEAARLAELAFDIAEHGVKTPIELRETEDAQTECLAGHRRLAAARLAGFSVVPALHRGVMSNAAAAATVLRGNLHRENFTTWQEAVLVTEVQERRRSDGYHDTARSLGAVMGWSHGKVNMLVRIRRALSPAFLATATGGEGEAAEEVLARASYRDLERLANEPDESKRANLLQRLLGAAAPHRRGSRTRPAYTYRATRTGGFILEVHRAVESLDAGDVAVVREALEAQLARVRARMVGLGRS